MVLFIAANLAVGFTFSTMAENQLQAMQMTFFFFLPSLLLSGFLFPFRGMPDWAQVLGSVFPLTHFLRIVRGILLKGSGWPRGRAGALADRAVHAGRGRRGAQPLPRDPRLTRLRRPLRIAPPVLRQRLDHRVADPPGGFEGRQEGGQAARLAGEALRCRDAEEAAS